MQFSKIEVFDVVIWKELVTRKTKGQLKGQKIKDLLCENQHDYKVVF